MAVMKESKEASSLATKKAHFVWTLALLEVTACSVECFFWNKTDVSSQTKE